MLHQGFFTMNLLPPSGFTAKGFAGFTEKAGAGVAVAGAGAGFSSVAAGVLAGALTEKAFTVGFFTAKAFTVGFFTAKAFTGAGAFTAKAFTGAGAATGAGAVTGAGVEFMATGAALTEIGAAAFSSLAFSVTVTSSTTPHSPLPVLQGESIFILFRRSPRASYMSITVTTH